MFQARGFGDFGGGYGVLDEMGASKAWAALNERQRKVVAELGWGETEAEGDGAGGWDAGGEHPRWFSELGSADRRRANSIGLEPGRNR